MQMCLRPLVAIAFASATALVVQQPACCPPRRCLPPAMQLRMPEDASTIESLVERTKTTNLVAVFYYTDPTSFAPAAWEDSWSTSGDEAQTPQDDLVARVADLVSKSEQYKGRPCLVLRIDRDLPGMSTICSKRGIFTFPTLEIWSRGMSESVAAANLEERLLSLGVASPTGSPSSGRSNSVVQGSVRAAPPPTTNDVDFFGIATTSGSQLTREGIARASKSEPKRDGSLPVGTVLSDSETSGLLPVEAMGMQAAKGDDDQARAGVDAALDALFAEPTFDDDDDMPPPI